MPKVTKENKPKKEQIEKKLEYIGLDLKEIPEFFKQAKPVEYRPLKSYEEEVTYQVYRYIPISKLEILLTPTNRLNEIKEKYSQAAPVYRYLDPIDQEDIKRHTTFLKMLKQVKIEQIEQIENEQKQFNKAIPFKVKFRDNYLWQIYYSDTTDTYFMMVPTEDQEYSMFFYLLKKQIEYHKTKKEEMIFVPISYEPYSSQYLTKSEISDLEKYLWLFTKEWPNVYEVYDKRGNLSIQIIGETVCYEHITSLYRVKLNTKEDAVKFYKLVKALFILQTELSRHYQFNVKIERYGSLEFYQKEQKITYENLAQMLNTDYKEARNEIIHYAEIVEQAKRTLMELRKMSIQKEWEYIQKEKEIATYLECRKTFMGRVRYFFAAKKVKKHKMRGKKEETLEEKVTPVEVAEEEKEQIEFIEKEYYTIEDIMKVHKDLEEISGSVKDIEADVKALRAKEALIDQKLKNAILYVEEIDRHEKSIFEFWKFANKDQTLLLEPGQEEIVEEMPKLEKVYDYCEDIEEIGTQIDKKQRNIFTKAEMDSVFITTTELLEVLNHIKDKSIVEESLQRLKEEAQGERILFQEENFDIFGGIAEDGTKIHLLGGKKHREMNKDKLRILEINKNVQLRDYTRKMREILRNVSNTFTISKNTVPIAVYIPAFGELKEDQFQRFYVRPEDAIKEIQEEKAINLYRFNIKENIPIVYYSNSMFFDNYNKTLPYGMDITYKGILDFQKIEIKQVGETDFRFNEEQEDNKMITKKVNVYEYDVSRREVSEDK